MGKSLVIVESPAKAKTINRYLGNDFIVKSSVGHIRDLPTSGNAKPVDANARAKEAAKTRKMSPAKKAEHRRKKARAQLVNRMGIDPAKDWRANYEVLPGKEKVVTELRKLARNADEIFLATDLDREGEAIAWHLREAIGGDPNRYRRVVFNEITKKAINDAFADPGEIDMNMVNAQQARRFLDRVVGYMVSPLLWAKIARGLSAGRVQSVAVRLLVEREREIRAFIPEEYWEVYADLAEQAGAARVRFQVTKKAGESFRPVNQAQTQEALDLLEGATYVVLSRDDRATSTRPGAPYITSTLQQAASTRLGFGVKKTMMLAQRLYEAGHITYMRTDSTNLSQEAVASCRDLIAINYGAEYLPEEPRVYSSKEGAQEAHEAIRPSDVTAEPGSLKGVEYDAERLYEMIWRQFVACQMPPARYTSTTVLISAANMELRVRGRILRFDGYTRAQPPAGRGDDDTTLPDYTAGQVLKLEELLPSQHFTKPPPRYGEASLVRELEKRGIGRPSTYASIITTIQDRGYVTLRNRRFYAEKIGDVVTDRLMESFDDLMDYGFTAGLEESLDEVSEGDVNWTSLLDQFYGAFESKLERAQSDEGMRANEPTMTDIPCPQCGRPMQLRTASTGVFLGCSGYSLPPKERCKSTINLVPGDEVVSVDGDDEEESRILRTKHRCAKCDTAMESFLIDSERKLHVCGNNPDCEVFEIERGEFKIKGYDGPTIECDKCGATMQLKTGRFGKYMGCTGEDCNNTRKLLRNGEVAPPKMDPVAMPELRCEKVDDTYILRDGAAGIFLAASQFPKNRETRAPFVDELIPHQNEIDPKYKFLSTAPVEDSAGRRTLIRFARKTREHYVTSEVEGKQSGWRADYVNGEWQVSETKPRPKKRAKSKTKAKRKVRPKAVAEA